MELILSKTPWDLGLYGLFKILCILVKNVKTIVKVCEVINDKGKIAMENQALRNKIKM